MLSKEHVEQLTARFKAEDHEFNYNKRVYLSEEAITARLDEVDPSWSFERLEIWNRGEHIIVSGRLTICGVSRDGVGMAKIEFLTDSDRESGEPEKAAITDALKRCARMFGIGRYILEMGSKVKDMGTLKKWLSGSSPIQPVVNPTPAQNQPVNPYNGLAVNSTSQAATNKPPVAEGTYLVYGFTVKLTRTNQPYLIFTVGENTYAYTFTRKPFEPAGYDVTDWKTVGDHVLPAPAEIKTVIGKDGRLEVKSAIMQDVFVEKQSA